MSRIIFCTKLQKDLPGLDMPPMPGALGREIFDTLSAQAWQDWLAHQTRLINEKHLNLMDRAHRDYLTEQLKQYLKGNDYDRAEGYIPEDH